MNARTPHISLPYAAIHRLDDGAINRIAAGEVVERPASAVKELVENALDAGAHKISIDISDGGKTLIRITDDGGGMAAADLPLAIARHATSKIDGSDLLNIRSFGFRGEALASMGAVGRLSLASRRGTTDEAAQITIHGGVLGPTRPTPLNHGTIVELRDLFYATPARLKFLRSDRAETQAITESIRRLAMAQPHVGFYLHDLSHDKQRTLFRADPTSGDFFDTLHHRLRHVLGAEFIENALKIDVERDGLHLTGYAALPTYSRGGANQQFLFVNGRPVQDRLLTGALRAAYFDFMSRGRYPAAVLNLACPPELVDVNVHPSKSEVRFRKPDAARGLIITALRQALGEAGHRASSTVGHGMLSAMRPIYPHHTAAYQGFAQGAQPQGANTFPPLPGQSPMGLSEEHPANWGTPQMPTDMPPNARYEEASLTTPDNGAEYPLGAARGQIHENYIIAQTADGLIIVDQHAAHERLAYERLKAQIAANGIVRQALLIPEIASFSPGECALLLEAAPSLEKAGLVIEAFGGDSIAIREIPAILGQINAPALLRDILDELSDAHSSNLVIEQIEAVLSRIACHGSVRSGRRMRGEEMNALLREMEITPHSGQCNHGRPTYVELKLHDIERLFGRT